MADVEITPGAWSVFYKPKYDEWHVAVPLAGTTMKRALWGDGIPKIGDVGVDNREAYARLIGAAPELLAVAEAQEALMKEAEKCIICGAETNCHRHYEQWQQIQIDRRAAIQKAKGKQ